MLLLKEPSAHTVRGNGDHHLQSQHLQFFYKATNVMRDLWSRPPDDLGFGIYEWVVKQIANCLFARPLWITVEVSSFLQTSNNQSDHVFLPVYIQRRKNK